MSGLRESKKAATRTALSRAAAQLAIMEGAEGVTVATIAAAAGVSPRTFHNYFASREEALIEFLNTTMQQLVSQLNELPEELSAREAVETLVINHLYAGESALNSFPTIIRVSEIVEMYGPPSKFIDSTMVFVPILEYFRKKMPGVPDFELMVTIHLHGVAVATALKQYYDSPDPRDPATAESLVRRATAMLKD